MTTIGVFGSFSSVRSISCEDGVDTHPAGAPGPFLERMDAWLTKIPRSKAAQSRVAS